MSEKQFYNKLLELEKKVCDLESKNLLFRKIIDKLPIGIQVFDKNGYSYYLNETQKELLGLPDISTGVGEFNVLTDPFSTSSGAAKNYKKVYEGEEFNHTFSYNLGNDQNKWETRKDERIFEEKIIPIKNDENRVESVLSILNDVTERLKYVADLKESNERFELFTNLTFEGIAIHKHGIASDVNDSLCDMCGYTREELIGANLIEKLIFKEDIPIVLEMLQKEIADPYEIRGVKKDGTLFPVEILAKNFSYQNENLRVAAIRDITKRKKVEKELLESNLRFDLAINATSDGLWDWNMVTNEIYYSPNWKLMLGYEEDELPNEFSVWEMLVHPDDLQKSWDTLKEHTSGKKKRFDIEFRMKHKKGHWVDILSRANAIFNEKGEAVRVVGTHVDISSKVENEKQLIELNATKDKFFSIIAHDLRGPLGAIMSFSELALQRVREGEFDKIEKYCDLIHKSTEQSYNLLNNLLQWSRLQTGRIDFNPEPLNLEVVVTKVKNLLEANYREKKININVSIDPSLQVDADHFMLDAIIRNILSNSIKYNNRNGRINIQAISNEDEVIVTIEDNGIEIKSENLDKLFKIESSFSTKGTNQETGTGLGLVLCKEFVELHGGKIWVESEPNVRTKFSFTIKQGR